MAWSFVAAGARASGNNSASLIAALPAGWAQNDLLVIQAYARGVSPTAGRSPALPAGWSEAARFEDADGSRGRIALFYKVAGASEADVTVTFSGAGVTGSAEMVCMMAWRGNATTAPLGDVGPDSNWAAAQNIGPISAITLTSNDQLLLVFAGRQQDMGVNGNSAAVSVLSGDGLTWAEAFETGTTLGSDCGLVLDYAFTTGQPTITNKTFTNSDVQTAAGCGMMVAFKIRPAAILNADPGSYSLTGTAASLERGAAVVAGSGSYLLSGSDASLQRTIILNVDSGPYLLTGTAADLTRGLVLAANSGAFVMTGSDAALTATRLLNADSGSYAMVGSDAALEYVGSGPTQDQLRAWYYHFLVPKGRFLTPGGRH